MACAPATSTGGPRRGAASGRRVRTERTKVRGSGCWPRPSLVGPRRVGQFVAVAVDLDDVAERVLAVDHPVGLLTGVVVAHRHPLLPTGGDDPRGESLEVRILDAEVEYAAFPVLELGTWRLRLAELEELDADPVGRREVGDLEAPEARAEDVLAHDPDRAVVLADLCRREEHVPPHDLRVELDSAFQVGNAKTDVRERLWICRCHCDLLFTWRRPAAARG